MMRRLPGLNDRERLILSTLEEAGEENVVALMNTVERCTGHAEEINRVFCSLFTLAADGLLEFAAQRDARTLKWIPLPAIEGLEYAEQAKTSFHWSEERQLWTWASSDDRLNVILTESGQTMAVRVLEHDGHLRREE